MFLKTTWMNGLLKDHQSPVRPAYKIIPYNLDMQPRFMRSGVESDRIDFSVPMNIF
jgi:hypothetical protein